MTKIQKTEEQWRAELSPEQYRVLREKGTEAPFTGKYVNVKDDGMYHCAGCGAELFASDTKFDAGCGWPSYWEPIDREVIDRMVDRQFGTVRIEVRCNNCGSHLGHVFEDGPEPTGERYCINSAAIDFESPTQK